MIREVAAGLQKDGLWAKALYKLASQHEADIAINNLRFLVQHGAPGVNWEPFEAVIAYDISNTRVQHNHARHNLAEMLFDGTPGVAKNVTSALDKLTMPKEGRIAVRAKGQSKLRAFVARCK